MVDVEVNLRLPAGDLNDSLQVEMLQSLLVPDELVELPLGDTAGPHGLVTHPCGEPLDDREGVLPAELLGIVSPTRLVDVLSQYPRLDVLVREEDQVVHQDLLAPGLVVVDLHLDRVRSLLQVEGGGEESQLA